MQHKQPKFSGILVVAVLMVLVLFFVSLSPLLAATGTKDTTYSEIYYYFENQQVTSFRLDLGTGSLELWLKEGKAALPESNAAASLPSGGLLSLGDSEDEDLPANGGTVYMTYKLPYGGDFNTGKISDFVDEYNEANPDAPMVFDYVAAKTSIPWLEIIFYVAMIASIGMLFMSMYRGGAGGGIMNVGRAKVKDQQENQRKATFADVAGADEEKAELQEVVEFLKAPNKFNSLGARIPHGVLLVGPPGTGKTLLARACAGEAGVPFYAISGSDFVEMYVGVGASRVRDLFEKAKKTMPSIIFIDEIDAVGRQRGAGLGGGHDEREQTLNQLLVEMDGFAINEGVIVMAATNRRDILDPALLRPGRFDRTILVNYPDMAGRVAILKVHAKGKPLADDVDLENIAKRVPFSTGAELENIMNEAAILAARGRLKAINQQTLVEAISRVQMGPEKRSHKVTQRDKRMVAIHEAGHAIVGHVLPNCDEVHLITIVPRGQAGGYTLSLPTEEDDLQTYSQLMDFVAMGLGGHAAEQLYLGEFTTGATSDLKKATEVCRRMVTQFGMSEKLGPVYLDGDQEVFVGMEFGQSRGYSEEMAARIDAEVKRLLEECYQKAVDALSANRDRMEKLVDALLKYDTISRREFVTLMETGALPDIQDADTRTTGDVMMQDMADEKKKENSEKSAETPEKSAETPEKTADAPENHPTDPHEA